MRNFHPRKTDTYPELQSHPPCPYSVLPRFHLHHRSSSEVGVYRTRAHIKQGRGEQDRRNLSALAAAVPPLILDAHRVLISGRGMKGAWDIEAAVVQCMR